MVARPVASFRHGAAAVPALLGEGPVWDAALGELVWVDIARGLVHRRRPGEAESSVDVGQPVGCAVPRAGGGLALALRDGFALLPHRRRPAAARGAGGAAALRHADERRRLRQPRALLGGHHVPPRRYAHGRALPARRRSDRHARAARSVDLERTGLEPRRPAHVPRGHATQEGSTSTSSMPRPARSAARRAAIPVAPEQGRPDGLAVDAEGGIWVALWGGGAVQRYSPEGRPDARIELPGEPGHELLLRRPGPRDALRHDGGPRSRARAARRIAVLLPPGRPGASRNAVRGIAVAALQGRRVLVTGAGRRDRPGDRARARAPGRRRVHPHLRDFARRDPRPHSGSRRGCRGRSRGPRAAGRARARGGRGRGCPRRPRRAGEQRRDHASSCRSRTRPPSCSRRCST